MLIYNNNFELFYMNIFLFVTDCITNSSFECCRNIYLCYSCWNKCEYVGIIACDTDKDKTYTSYLYLYFESNLFHRCSRVPNTDGKISMIVTVFLAFMFLQAIIAAFVPKTSTSPILRMLIHSVKL